jgi:GntR family transcriptional regulator
MKVVIDIEAETPVFAQLIAQIKHAVKSGALAPGDPLPSIRQLANDLELDNKTVAKAYRLLQRDGIVQSKGYRGTFVRPDAKAHSNVDLKALALERVESAVSALKQAGLTDSEIRIAFANVMNGSTK